MLRNAAVEDQLKEVEAFALDARQMLDTVCRENEI